MVNVELRGGELSLVRKTDRKRWERVVRQAVRLSVDRTRAAARLEVSLSTLQRWLRELGI